MFYDEEELLEAVDMLMEDYDLSEDEAMELVLEAYEDELYSEGVRDYVGDPRNLRNSGRDLAKAGRQFAKDAAIPAAGVGLVGAGLLARRAIKKRQAKRERIRKERMKQGIVNNIKKL